MIRPRNKVVVVIYVDNCKLSQLRDCVASLVWHTRAPCELAFATGYPENDLISYMCEVRDAAPLRVWILRTGPDDGPLSIFAEADAGSDFVFLDGSSIVGDCWLDHLEGLAHSDPTIVAVSPFAGEPGESAGGLGHHSDVERTNAASLRRGVEMYGQWSEGPPAEHRCLFLGNDHVRALLDSGLARAASGGPARIGDFLASVGKRMAVALDTYLARSRERVIEPGDLAEYGSLLQDHGLARDHPEIEGIPADFKPDGLLPPFDFRASFASLRDSLLISGPPDLAGWDAAWRLMLVDNLESISLQLRRVGIDEVFIGGSFVERKPHPGDLDVYVNSNGADRDDDSLFGRLNSLAGEFLWSNKWSDRRLGPTTGNFPRSPMWHKYRIELLANFGQPISTFRSQSGKTLDIPTAFRTCKISRKPKGIVRVAI